MTGRGFAKLARKHLMPYLSGFALKDGYVYALPVDRLWRRFVLDPSGFSRESFTLGCAASPLYVHEAAHSYPIWPRGSPSGPRRPGRPLVDMAAG